MEKPLWKMNFIHSFDKWEMSTSFNCGYIIWPALWSRPASVSPKSHFFTLQGKSVEFALCADSWWVTSLAHFHLSIPSRSTRLCSEQGMGKCLLTWKTMVRALIYLTPLYMHGHYLLGLCWWTLAFKGAMLVHTPGLSQTRTQPYSQTWQACLYHLMLSSPENTPSCQTQSSIPKAHFGAKYWLWTSATAIFSLHILF